MARIATANDLEQINKIRQQVNELHVAGRPDVFRAGFCDELRDHAAEFIGKDDRAIIVAERGGMICGFASVNEINRPLSPYNNARSFFHVEEFGVDEAYRRQGVGTELFDAIRQMAKDRGYKSIELDMWEFNDDALKFYESLGFRTYRRHLEYVDHPQA